MAPNDHDDRLELSTLEVKIRPTCFHEMLGIDPNSPESAEVNRIIEEGHRKLTELEKMMRDAASKGLAEGKIFASKDGGVSDNNAWELAESFHTSTLPSSLHVVVGTTEGPSAESATKLARGLAAESFPRLKILRQQTKGGDQD